MSTSSEETRPKQRNYKSMTKERRIEANARERNRVHTISAAFEQLRAVIPTKALPTGTCSTSKLSKLAVVRIASAYILALANLCGRDYSVDQSKPSLGSCLQLLSQCLSNETARTKTTSS